jgi:hypothetical protein
MGDNHNAITPATRRREGDIAQQAQRRADTKSADRRTDAFPPPGLVRGLAPDHRRLLSKFAKKRADRHIAGKAA